MTGRTGRSPRIRDIARVVGVSPSTVSVVLNERDTVVRVSAETRRRVLATASDLGYVPNIAARRLAQAAPDMLTLAILTPLDARLPLIGRVIRGVHAGLGPSVGNVELLVEVYRGGRLSESPFLQSRNRANGVVVTNSLPEDDEYLEGIPRAAVPFVVLQRLSRHSHVNLDNKRTGREVIAYLHGLGHRHIGAIVPDVPSIALADRLAGYLEGLDSCGLQGSREWIARAEFSNAGGYQAARQILAGQRRPTAVFVLTDAMAVGAIRAIRESGLRVPDDVAVVGHDDLEFAAYVDPPLTTVRVPIEEMAARAVQMLTDLVLHRARGPLQESFEGHLVVRRSSGGPRPALQPAP